MQKEIIRIEGICHKFSDGFSGIRDISLSIDQGEFIILAGKNGSGKTTLIRHLNGLLAPDSGRVLVNGRDVSKHLVQTRQTIGMVFQDADAQIVGNTVFDEAAFGLENLKFSRTAIRERVDQVLERQGLSHLRDRNPSGLSGGEKRRLTVAGVLVMDPRVIVFDEPFSNLDYPGILQVLATIVELNQSGRTIIMATHDVEPVICEASRIIIMEDGAVKQDGNPLDTITRLESYGVREPCASKLGLGLKSWLT
jgi:biotin transport system ATP-binding protein